MLHINHFEIKTLYGQSQLAIISLYVCVLPVRLQKTASLNAIVAYGQ